MAFILNCGQEPDNHVKAPIDVAFQLDCNTASGAFDIPVPEGFMVTQVRTVVTEVFDGSPTLKIGDASDDDGYLTSANIAPGTAATATTPAVKTASGTGSGNPYANGKYFATAGQVRLTWVQGTNPTTGVLKGVVSMVNLKKGGVPAGATTKTPL